MLFIVTCDMSTMQTYLQIKLSNGHYIFLKAKSDAFPPYLGYETSNEEEENFMRWMKDQLILKSIEQEPKE